MNKDIEKGLSIGLFLVSILIWIVAIYLMFQE